MSTIQTIVKWFSSHFQVCYLSLRDLNTEVFSWKVDAQHIWCVSTPFSWIAVLSNVYSASALSKKNALVQWDREKEIRERIVRYEGF